MTKLISLITAILCLYQTQACAMAAPQHTIETEFAFIKTIQSKNLASIDIRLKNDTSKYIGGVTYDIAYDEGTDCAMVYELDIDEEYQRRGLGTQLLSMAFAHMKEHNIKHASWVAAPETIPFYKRFGASSHGHWMFISFDDNNDQSIKKE